MGVDIPNWLSLIIGISSGLITSLFVVIKQESILSYYKGKSIISLEKYKSKDLSYFYKIKYFKEDNNRLIRNQAEHLSDMILYCAMFTIAFITLTFFILISFNRIDISNSHFPNVSDKIVATIFLLFLMIQGSFLFNFNIKNSRLLFRVDNFDEYANELNKKWQTDEFS